MTRELLTNSSVSTFRSCQRKYQIQYVLGVRPLRDAEALKFGTLVHKALEGWWKATADRFGAAMDMLPPDTDPFDRARITAMMSGYTARWESQRYEVIGVEVEFVAGVVNPLTGASSRTFDRGGKIDAIVRDADGRKLIVEHKTSSEDISAGSDYWRRLRMDSQISTYYEGARALGHDIWGCVYDVLGKFSAKPGKATPVEQRKYTKDGRLYANQRETDETPREFEERLFAALVEDPTRYYQRGEIVRLDKEIEEHRLDLWLTSQSILERRRLNLWPRNPDACVRFNQTCPFFSSCCGEASLDDPMEFRRAERAHEELQLPKEEAST